MVDGNVGIRYVSTDLDLSGTRLIFPADPDGGGPLPPPPGVLTPTVADREFSAWLPNASARVRFTPQVQMRLSYSRTQTRPSFTDLRVSATIDRPPDCFNQTPVPENCVLTGSGGNPFLQPLTSDNYDASLEYYFSRTGFVAVSAFYRDMEGFIETVSTDVTDPTGLPLRLTGPTNAGSGTIKGFEAQLTTFFDFGGLPDWLSNFGIQANVTHIDAGSEFTQNGVTIDRRLVDIAAWSYNLIGMYEGGGLSARLAYNRRGSFLDLFQNRGDHLYLENARPQNRLDFSTSYDVLPNLTIFADWTNILQQPFRSTLTRIDLANGTPTGFEATFPRFVRFNETTVSLGVRFRL